MTGARNQTKRPRVRAFVKSSAVVTAIVLAAFVLLYAATPAMVAFLGPRLAARYGLTSLDVEVGYPGLHGFELHRLALANDAFTVAGHDGTVSYSVTGLRHGRLDMVEFAELEIARISTETPRPTDAHSATAWHFPMLPVARLRIENLLLRSPDIGFLGTGHAEIGADTLSVKIDGVEPEEASRFSLMATLNRDGRYQATFGTRGDTDRKFLWANGLIGADAIRIDAKVDLSGYALSLLADLVGLPHGSGSISGIVHTDIPWPIPAPFDWRSLNIGVPEFEVGWRSAQPQVVAEKISGRLAVTAGKMTGSVTGDAAFMAGNGKVELSMPSEHRFDLNSGKLSGTGGLQLRFVRDEDRLEADVVSYTVAATPEPRLDVEAKVTGNLLGAGIDGYAKGEIRLASQLSNGGHGRLDFTGGASSGRWSGRGTLASSFRFAGDKWQFEGTARTGILGTVPFTIELDHAAGSGLLTASPKFELTRPLAKALLQDWRSEYDLDAGQVDAGLRLGWGKAGELKTELDISVRQGRAHYGQDRANGISADLTLAFDEPTAASGRTIRPATVHVDKIDAGLEISDVATTLSYSNGELEVGTVDAKVLGGHARAGPIGYTVATGAATFPLLLSDIELSRILALEGEDVTGTGRLDATLPVTLRNNVPSVSQGSFKAQPPGGELHIKPTLAGMTSQPGLEFALLALKDFTYTDLGGEVDYAESGDARLAIHLKGNNPAVEHGRAIQYNLTINENIPVLLKSLHMSDRVTERIDQDVLN